MKPHGNEEKVRLLTIKEASRLINGLAEHRIRQLCASGELPCIKVGNKHLINEQTLIDYATPKNNQAKGILADE